MKDIIRGLLAEHGKLSVPLDEVHDGDDLFAAGLTSLSSVNVMLALEARFDIEFPNEMLNRATFQSIDAIASGIEGLGIQAA
jgi:acyl carrier protein